MTTDWRPHLARLERRLDRLEPKVNEILYTVRTLYEAKEEEERRSLEKARNGEIM